MRRRAVLLSVLAHGGVLAVIGPCARDRERAERHGHEAPTTQHDPIELVFVSLQPESRPSRERVASAAVAPGASSARIRGGVEGIRDAAPASDSSDGTSTPTAGAPVYSMRMRGQRANLTLGHDVAGGTRGAGDESGPSSRWSFDPKIKMVPSGGGTQQVRDAVADIKVAPDGTVHVEDRPLFTFHVQLPTPDDIVKNGRRMERELAKWIADPYRKTRVGSTSDLPRHLQAVPGACDSYGADNCFTAADQAEQWELEDEDLQSTGTKAAGGKADLTGWLMKKLVGDPYASRKLKILDQTRPDRIRSGERFRREQLDRSAVFMQDHLEALWRSTADPVQRRAALFALWDESAEGEDEAGAAGERARIMVLGWIRGHLPQGSADAFTAEEIRTLDGRRASKQHFDPYR